MRTSDLEKSKKHDQIIHLWNQIWKSGFLKTEHLEVSNPDLKSGFAGSIFPLVALDIKLADGFQD